jgi:hypothetical protein
MRWVLDLSVGDLISGEDVVPHFVPSRAGIQCAGSEEFVVLECGNVGRYERLNAVTKASGHFY